MFPGLVNHKTKPPVTGPYGSPPYFVSLANLLATHAWSTPPTRRPCAGAAELRARVPATLAPAPRPEVTAPWGHLSFALSFPPSTLQGISSSPERQYRCDHATTAEIATGV